MPLMTRFVTAISSGIFSLLQAPRVTSSRYCGSRPEEGLQGDASGWGWGPNRQLPTMKIIKATEKDMPKVRELFREYQEWLGVDFCFQNFEEELATLPGAYAQPTGVIFLATETNDITGCVGIRPTAANEAELKRLYVRPGHQGCGIGKQLFLAAMSEAKAMGYAAVVLDTLPTMQTAKSLYISYGFKEIPVYYENPEKAMEYYRYAFSQDMATRKQV